MSSPQRRTATAPSGGGTAASAFDGRSASSRGFGLGRTQSLAGAPLPGGRLHSRTSSTLSAAEEASMAAAQELASVMNAPPIPGAASWLSAWPFGQAFGQEDFDAPPPPLPPGTLPEVQLSDFAKYLRTVGDQLQSLGRTKGAGGQRMAGTLGTDELRESQGQGLVAAMREVPAQFFQEAFTLDQKALWEEVVQVGTEEARQESLEQLCAYLDVVETHLVREIAARTDNFFDASGYIQDVRASVGRLYQEVAALRQKMQALEQDTGGAVATSQQLQQQRSNLVSALDMLAAMEVAAQAQAALQGLLPQSGGMAVDYAGAIDVLEVLQGLLDEEALLALDCFSHLPGQIVETAQAVDDLMTSELLERTRFPDVAAAAATEGILERLRYQVAAQEAAQGPAAAPRRRRTSSQSGGASAAPSRQLSAEDGAELAALAAVPLADGPAVDAAVAWLERCCVPGTVAGTRGGAIPGFAAADGEGEVEGLQEVLLPLVIGLRRMGRLGAVMRQLKQAGAARLKELLSQVVESCLSVLDPEPGPGDASHLLASHRSVSPDRDGTAGRDGTAALAARLARLPGPDFQWVLEAVLLATKLYLNHCTAVGEAVQTILEAAKATKPQLAAAAQEARECGQAAAEAAAARWSRLLSGRARGSAEGSAASVIRLGELQGVLELTDVLASLVERYGVRGVLGLRSALQQLCKASLDGLHSRGLSKLTSLLDREQWMAVEVPPQFQGLAAQLEERGDQAGAQPAAIPVGQSAAAAEGTGAGGGSGGSRRPSSDAERGGDGGGGTAGAASDGAGGGEEAVPRKFTITPPEGPASDATPDQQQQQRQQQHANGTAAGAAQPPPPGPAPVLVVGGRGYHVVNTQLLMLSMLREYLAFRDAVPAFAAEVAQRVLELLKVFNSRTCQLVLGAGAMQVSGLKSITAKHLALSCQCLDAFVALQPCLVAAFTAGLLPPRRDMLVADFGRALQDYRIHHEEVCSKLVAIMRERLSANIKQLPALAAGWPAGGERPELPAPSGFATTAAKQLQILSGALSPLMLPEELHSIFGRIGLMFSRTLAEAYELLEPHGAAWEQQLRADMQFMLNCLRQLPMDPAQRDANLEGLTQLYEQRFLFGPAAQPAAPAAAPAAQPWQSAARPEVPAPPPPAPALPAEQGVQQPSPPGTTYDPAEGHVSGAAEAAPADAVTAAGAEPPLPHGAEPAGAQGDLPSPAPHQQQQQQEPAGGHESPLPDGDGFHRLESSTDQADPLQPELPSPAFEGQLEEDHAAAEQSGMVQHELSSTVPQSGTGVQPAAGSQQGDPP